MEHEKFGIYLNVKQLKVVRINSSYWIPSGKEWVFITPEVNATLLSIRDLVRQRKLVNQPDKIFWGGITEFEK
jgi:hypothetical protein